MRQCAELKVVYHYDRQGEFVGYGLFLTSQEGSEVKYECEPATGPAALAKLLNEGWAIVTSVALPWMATGGERRRMTAARPSQLIHMLVRTVPDPKTPPI